ncbi:MAG: hypothetical protein HY650_06670 [Acidobacteria bacterium]|nr:hypothetical protein [Acidobacteriota bacterium]
MKKVYDAFIRRLAVLLSYAGVDAIQYQALLQASLALDFRSTSLMPQRGTSGSKSALLTTSFIYLMVSSIMGVFLLTQGSLLLFTWVILTYSMVMLAMAVLIEFGSTVINPDDFHILGARPVSSRTYFAVKFSNLAFYILIFGTSLNIVPAILGAFLPEARFYYPVLYFAVAMLASLFMAGVIVAVYGVLIRIFNYERFKDIIAYFQIAFSFLTFFGYQLIPRYLEENVGSLGTFVPVRWMEATPSLWFASMVQLGLGVVDRRTVLLSLAGFAAVFIFTAILTRSVSIHYAEFISRMLSTSSTRRPAQPARSDTGRLGPVLRLWLRSSEERAFFHFIVLMIRRNRQLKIQLYPNLGIIFVFLAIALVDHRTMIDPLAENRLEMSTVAPVAAFLFAALGITSLLPYSDEYQGSWIFALAPLRRKDHILRGIKKAVLAMVFLPVYILNATVFAFFWPVHHSLIYNLYALLGGYLLMEVLLFRLSDLPFTLKIVKGLQNQRLMLVLFFLPIAGLMVYLQKFAFRSPLGFVATMAAMLLISTVLSRINAGRFSRAVASAAG